MEFKACKHLIFDKEVLDPRIELKSDRGFCYWHRPKEILPGDDCASDVQFCNLRGRLNSKVACLEGMAECSEYESEIYDIEV